MCQPDPVGPTRLILLGMKLQLFMIGDGGVGKSSVTLALLKRPFEETYDPTILGEYLPAGGVVHAVDICDSALAGYDPLTFFAPDRFIHDHLDRRRRCAHCRDCRYAERLACFLDNTVC